MILIDKTTLKLLKTLYKKGLIDSQEADRITNTLPNHRNRNIELLQKHGYIFALAGSVSDEGYARDIHYQISLEGRAFIEDRRRKIWSFILPYSITTLIAILSLICMLLDYLG